MLTAQGQARQDRCFAPCEHWRVCVAEGHRRDSDFADFCARPGLEPGKWLLLDPDRWEGPDAGCPGGYWTGLPPAVLPDPATARAERDVVLFGPVVETLLFGADNATRDARIDALVAEGIIVQSAADTFKAELNKPEVKQQ